ncbi:3-oxoacyl-[acyl-carrier-protein] reductase [Mycoplasma sp. P36-A1]|uniref:3-oxoacyl-[acyl-carrier-protein] reductase n=1 Tax=Mycoplasma sp. P36-A1 TaxID=3252900 RepID=UPI003C2F0202
MNKSAIITGGSRGIGLAISKKLIEDGINIIATGIGEIEEQNIIDAKELAEQNNVSYTYIEANVVDKEQCQKVVEKTLEMFEKVDILVNNAGITNDMLLMKMKEEDFSRVLEINLVGSFNMIKAVQKPMQKARSGRIINMGSVIGEIGNVGQANYAASKAGLMGLSKSVAREVAARNITCNVVAPGYIDTDMTKKLDDSVKEKILANVPLKRMGTAQDVANLVSFLSSEQAAYITGQTINVCGGMVM